MAPLGKPKRVIIVEPLPEPAPHRREPSEAPPRREHERVPERPKRREKTPD
jgi:hypothetical protein